MPKDFNYLMTECHNFNEINHEDHLNDLHQQIKYDFSKDSNLQMTENSNMNNFIAVKSIGKIELIPYAEIYWLQASSNYIEIHLECRTILHRDSLGRLENKLSFNHFLRVHRSSVINLNKIKHINSELGRYNLISLTNGDEVKLSKSYRSALFHHLGIDT